MPSEMPWILQPQPTKGSDIMTQDHVAGFASELVKMAQAVERVPQLERDVAEWQRMASMRTDRIIELEVALEASRTYAAGLEQRIHDAEVARDDAELRFLEVDDAKDTLVRVLDNLGKDIIGALQAVAPEPTAPTESQRPHEVPEGYREIPRPEGGFDVPHYEKIPTEVSPAVMEAVNVDAPLAGQSESPLLAATEDSSQSVGTTSETTAAPSTSTDAGQSEPDPTSSALSPNPTTSADAVPPALVSDTAVASSTGEGDTSNPFVPPAQPIEGSPPAQSSDTSTGDDTNRLLEVGEPRDKYSNEWYHWVDAVPARRLRVLGY